MVSVFLSGLLATLVAQTVDAYVVPQGKLPDLHKLGTQDYLFPYLAGAAPYFSFPGNYGIPTTAPEGCEISQLQVIARHGERYPTTGRARRLFSTYYKLSNYTREFNESLSFLNDDYTFFISDSNNIEQETTYKNSLDVLNPYTGQRDAEKHARQFLDEYSALLENTTSFPIFAASSRRVHDTAQFFSKALGEKYNVTLQVVSEAPTSGANTISAGNACPGWNESANANVTDAFSTDYLKNIASRLNRQNKGLNLTQTDAFNLFNWCAFEINVRGYSYMCDVFTQEELINYSYYDDLTSYYQDGPGYDMIYDVGSNLFNASVKLLKQSEELDLKVWISFTHDTDIVNLMTTIGLFDNGVKLDPTSVPFRDLVYRKSWQTPQGARLYTQKYKCSNETYVRYVLNDAVIPLESCKSGPGFSCPTTEFYDYAADRMNGRNFYKSCDVASVSNVTELTFYWDYNERHYNDTLLNQ